MTKCKNCIYFKRGKWAEEFGGEDQLSGTCELLLEMLKMNNGGLFFLDEIVIQESFGCILGKKKKEIT